MERSVLSDDEIRQRIREHPIIVGVLPAGTKTYTIAELVRANRRRTRPVTRDEALGYLYRWGTDGMRRPMLQQLMPDELKQARCELELIRRHDWEREMFGAPKTREWTRTCGLDPKYLTT